MIRFARSGAAASATQNQQDELVHYVEALDTVAERLAAATSSEAVLQSAMDVIREAFLMTYSSTWWIDPATKALVCRQESGQVGEEFRRVTQTASFPHGIGLAGRAWKERKLLFAPDLAEVHDCVRAPVASRSGVRSAVAFPLILDGDVVGTMDFMADPDHTPGPVRLTVLRTVAKLVSQALERVRQAERRAETDRDMAAINEVVHRIAARPTSSLQSRPRWTRCEPSSAGSTARSGPSTSSRTCCGTSSSRAAPVRSSAG